VLQHLVLGVWWWGGVGGEGARESGW
jgi:hypothetical protein